MGISDVISLLGGIALFLFGMSLMGEGLKKVAGSKLELVLYRLSSTPLKGVLLGTGVTAVIQSSSATSVMVVGFVNSGMMKVNQAIGIVMGAILGTSVTGWILCLSSLSGGSGWVTLLSTATLTGLVAVVGIILRGEVVPGGEVKERCVRCPDIVALAESVKNDLICIAVSYYKIEAVPAVERFGSFAVAQGVHDGVQIVGVIVFEFMQQGLIIVIVAVDAVDICDVQHGRGEGHQQQYKERHGYQLCRKAAFKFVHVSSLFPFYSPAPIRP